MCKLHTLTLDQKPTTPRQAFQQARRVETSYAVRLRKIAAYVAEIIGAFDPKEDSSAFMIRVALERYASTIEPWAEAVAKRMVAEVSARDQKAWGAASEQIGRALAREIQSAPTGAVMRKLVADQVTLIKSLPLEAAQRVQRLSVEAVEGGERIDGIVREIMRTGEVTKSRATLIARTEVGRATSALTQARAEHVGSVGYIWRSVGDSDVRPSHRRINGSFVKWDEPPTLDGLTGHAGALPNCRCFCDPVIPDVD